MEFIIKNIIREELKKALFEIQEPTVSSEESEIIYDFELGRAFGINKLAREIDGLNNYYLSDYFPHSEFEENWMFEIETYYNSFQLIEITRRIDENYKSWWKLDISNVVRGENQTPEISDTTEFVNGYDNFVLKVNNSLGKKINKNFL